MKPWTRQCSYRCWKRRHGNPPDRVEDDKSTREQATLFRSEPQTGFTNGRLTKEQKQESINYWQEVAKAINEVVAEARHNPETARSLFALTALWAAARPRDPGALARRDCQGRYSAGIPVAL
jgi:hypothetical protein